MNSNQLAGETSPYLLQHSHNPVAWRPWGPGALDEARRDNKPILLSVGYAACHWCHVMAHESFEDAETARLMNENFVNVKVDREERPDLDAIYQNALALLGQQGGWPLTMFLTPKGEPFWGGTYFPPEARWGRPAFREVLDGVARAWRRQPEKVRQNVDALGEALARGARTEPGHAIDLAALDKFAAALLGAVDPVHGGLGGAPKFPQPTAFEFLWRTHRRGGDRRFREAVELTLDHMALGGIWDHLGGGFHRYATDEHWLVPHFEKMLYDNALLIDLYTLVWQETRSGLFAERVVETIGWALREMRTEGDAFAASLDADSEGGEGLFHTWTFEEIQRLLPEAWRDDFNLSYGVVPGGNWEGRVILDRNRPQHLAGPSLERRLAEARQILFAARETRPRPGRDDKVLADWNGLMIAALANAGLAFGRDDWVAAGRGAYDAVLARMALPGDRLGHSWRRDRLLPHAVLDDYANLSRAALALFEATGDFALIDQAERWVAVANAHYWDEGDGGYFLTADDTLDVITRPKAATDPATPSGNGTMLQVLTRLWAITGKAAYRDRADSVVGAFAGEARHSFGNMGALLNGVELLARAQTVVIIGQPEAPATQAMVRTVAEACLPNRVLIRLPPGARLPDTHPAHGKAQRGDAATAHVCAEGTCQAPVTSPEALRKALAR
ncbi:MAG: thioredoxin domain-containing protein [Alphaproteobacteria bacterium]|nr:thioredoxin domain-containing protein [Alphaproteobacteria bacterium]